MTDEDPSGDDGDESGLSGLLATLQNFDWLNIPGAARAIARLVTGGANAAAALFDLARAHVEGKTVAMRDVTKAKSKVIARLGNAVAKAAEQDPALVARMTRRLLDDELQHQTNREAVAREAVQLLAEQQPPSGHAAEPSEDWLNVFSSYAEKASSAVLRAHWARILAGEIRAPGTFSLAALQLLSIMDSRLASLIETASGWIVDDWIIMSDALSVSPHYDVLLQLDAIGFLRLHSAKFLTFNSDGLYLIPFRTVSIIIYGQPGARVVVGGALLTLSGKELLTLVPPSEDITVIETMARQLKNIAGVAKVQFVHGLNLDGPPRPDQIKLELT